MTCKDVRSCCRNLAGIIVIGCVVAVATLGISGCGSKDTGSDNGDDKANRGPETPSNTIYMDYGGMDADSDNVVKSLVNARQNAKIAAIRVEMMGLTSAVEVYKQNYGMYPPSEFDQLDLHLNRLFPRRVADDGPTREMDRAQMLVFCLQGYTRNPQYPLTVGPRQPFFDFDPERLVDGRYYPPGVPPKVPYTYFRKVFDANSHLYVWSEDQVYGDDNTGLVRPDPNAREEFQIICAGVRGRYNLGNIVSYRKPPATGGGG